MTGKAIVRAPKLGYGDQSKDHPLSTITTGISSAHISKPIYSVKKEGLTSSGFLHVPFSNLGISGAIQPAPIDFIERIAPLSARSKIAAIIEDRPQYLIYLVGSVSASIFYVYQYLYFLPSSLYNFLSVTKAKADGNADGVVLNGVDYTPWIFGLLAFLTLVSSYAALFSKKPKTNESGWDLIKILFGASVGYFIKSK